MEEDWPEAIDVKRNLRILAKTGWVKEHDCEPRTYTINLEDPWGEAPLEFFKKIGYF